MKTQVWAHRGASGCAPENTMEAFELALQQGADGIELDVQMSRDGKLVVIHDETIDRTSDGTGMVCEYTLEELRSFTYNRTFPEYAHAGIPLLEEVFEFLRTNSMTVNIELKNSIVRYPLLEERVLSLATDMGVAGRVIYSSFNHKSVRKIKGMLPEAEAGILYSDGWVQVPAYAKRLGADAVHPAGYQVLNTKLIEQCHRKGLKVNAWTINREEDMKKLAEGGADAIITNYPAAGRQVVDGCFLSSFGKEGRGQNENENPAGCP